MSDPRVTFQRLLALATHPTTPGDEARTAAYAALMLARREGWTILIREPAQPPAPPVAWAPPKQAPDSTTYADFEADFEAALKDGRL